MKKRQKVGKSTEVIVGLGQIIIDPSHEDTATVGPPLNSLIISIFTIVGFASPETFCRTHHSTTDCDSNFEINCWRQAKNATCELNCR